VAKRFGLIGMLELPFNLLFSLSSKAITFIPEVRQLWGLIFGMGSCWDSEEPLDIYIC
jgi:hypothetical protein